MFVYVEDEIRPRWNLYFCDSHILTSEYLHIYPLHSLYNAMLCYVNFALDPFLYIKGSVDIFQKEALRNIWHHQNWTHQ